MKISVFNGSPRGLNSNSNVILDWVIEGIGEELEKNIIRNLNNHNDYLQTIINSQVLVIAFPLYTDAMPGIVMNFFEAMGKIQEKLKGKRILFIIHSGFPEGKQSFHLRDYLINYVNKLNLDLIDVIIMGNSEGTRLMPPSMLKKKKYCFNEIGKSIKENRPIDASIKNKLLMPVELSLFRKIYFRLLSLTGAANFYWNSQLKKNDAFENSFDTPYID